MLLSLTASVYAQTAGAVCHQPESQCATAYTFAPYQLPFRINESLVFGKAYHSKPFYAVILKSVRTDGDAGCTMISESERAAAQAIWPTRKVFTSRYTCPEELVLYQNTDQSFNFLAVYAGDNINEARRVLKQARSNVNFSQAYIKRLRAVLEYST